MGFRPDAALFRGFLLFVFLGEGKALHLLPTSCAFLNIISTVAMSHTINSHPLCVGSQAFSLADREHQSPHHVSGRRSLRIRLHS